MEVQNRHKCYTHIENHSLEWENSDLHHSLPFANLDITFEWSWTPAQLLTLTWLKPRASQPAHHPYAKRLSTCLLSALISVFLLSVWLDTSYTNTCMPTRDHEYLPGKRITVSHFYLSIYLSKAQSVSKLHFYFTAVALLFYSIYHHSIILYNSISSEWCYFWSRGLVEGWVLNQFYF